MRAPGNIAGLVLAGGSSQRFGSSKAHALLEGKPLLHHVMDRLTPQVNTLAVAGPAESLPDMPGCPFLSDGLHKGKGPLAGLLAGLQWAARRKGITWLLTAPCDVPGLPRNLCQLLLSTKDRKPRALRVNGQLEAGCALWPVFCHDAVASLLEGPGPHSLQHAFRHLHGTVFEPDACLLEGHFLNMNTPRDLERLQDRISLKDPSVNSLNG